MQPPSSTQSSNRQEANSTTWRHIVEDGTLYGHHSENPKSNLPCSGHKAAESKSVNTKCMFLHVSALLLNILIWL